VQLSKYCEPGIIGCCRLEFRNQIVTLNEMKLSAQSVQLVPHISRDFGVMFPEAAITRFVLLSCQLQRYFTIQVNDKFKLQLQHVRERP
jgi:hypothetical protein